MPPVSPIATKALDLPPGGLVDALGFGKIVASSVDFVVSLTDLFWSVLSLVTRSFTDIYSFWTLQAILIFSLRSKKSYKEVSLLH